MFYATDYCSIRRIKHFRTSCYWKIINFSLAFITPPVVDYICIREPFANTFGTIVMGLTQDYGWLWCWEPYCHCFFVFFQLNLGNSDGFRWNIPVELCKMKKLFNPGPVNWTFLIDFRPLNSLLTLFIYFLNNYLFLFH